MPHGAFTQSTGRSAVYPLYADGTPRTGRSMRHTFQCREFCNHGHPTPGPLDNQILIGRPIWRSYFGVGTVTSRGQYSFGKKLHSVVRQDATRDGNRDERGLRGEIDTRNHDLIDLGG